MPLTEKKYISSPISRPIADDKSACSWVGCASGFDTEFPSSNPGGGKNIKLLIS